MDACEIWLLLNKANSGNKPSFFLWKKPTVVWAKISEKKTTFFPVWDLVNTRKQIEKTSFATKKYFKTLKDMIIYTVRSVHNFLSHLHFFKVVEIMFLKYTQEFDTTRGISR